MINRRNTLLLLGVFVVAGGVVLATGAFSTVEADRTVSIETAGDGSALLGLEANSTYNGIENVSSGSENTVTIGLVDINENARTSFDEAVIVTNNGSQDVWLYASDTSGEGITFLDSAGGSTLDQSNPVEISANGGTATIALEVDTSGAASDGDDIDVTFTAATEEP